MFSEFSQIARIPLSLQAQAMDFSAIIMTHGSKLILANKHVVNAIAGFGGNLYAGVGGVVWDTRHGNYPSDTGAGIFRSTDDGATWELMWFGWCCC